MIEEIQSQRQLNAAERGDLKLINSEINSLSALKEVIELYSRYDMVKDKNVVIDPTSDEAIIVSDKILVRRILGNMLKNALEASLPQATITLKCSKKENGIEFSVHNSSFIPREIQHQVFQRSFSTKGSGRGIGTYSMKLLGENYLEGKVWFKSTPEQGTTFYFFINGN